MNIISVAFEVQSGLQVNKYGKTMGVFEFIGIITFLYYLINIISWIVLDSDIELWFKERWGKSIGKRTFCRIAM